MAILQETSQAADLATRADLTELGGELRPEITKVRIELKAEIAEVRAEIAEVRAELKAEIAELRAETKAEIADLRSEQRQSELRLEAKLESIKGEILNRVFGLILGCPGRQYRRNCRCLARGSEAHRTLIERSGAAIRARADAVIE